MPTTMLRKQVKAAPLKASLRVQSSSGFKCRTRPLALARHLHADLGGADDSIISELWDVIDSNPPAIEAREILLQHYIERGDLDVVEGTAQELSRLDPTNAIADAFLTQQQVQRLAATSVEKSQTRKESKRPVSSHSLDNEDPRTPRFSSPPRTNESCIVSEERLVNELAALRLRADVLLSDRQILCDLCHSERIHANGYGNKNDKRRIRELLLLRDGHIGAVFSGDRPPAVRVVARALEAADEAERLDLAVSDLELQVAWLRALPQNKRAGFPDADAVRQAVVKRVAALSATLPDSLHSLTTMALLHIEHEQLGRTYMNTETLILGEPIVDIPRDRFWASEDGYAWDMEELASSLAANSGVMRNPLTREIFSASDVRAIMSHPNGRHLGALGDQQRILSQGIRDDTVRRLESLAKILLQDPSTDQLPSHRALDEWAAYVATLPDTEQRAIDELRVPATDTNTGIPFDFTIGETVRDSRSNRMCMHKTGDFLSQAARHLQSSSNRGPHF